MNRRLLIAAAATALLAAALTVYVDLHPLIQQDVILERDVQAVNWGPLTNAFRFFSWIGDTKGLVVEVLIFLGVLAFNRRAWLIAAGSPLTGAWYEVLNHVVLRPRPTAVEVLRVTEHPPGSSFPSGHTMFAVTVVTVLMVCFVMRFLPRPAPVVGWVVAAVLVVLNGIGRIDVGAHWPTDVIAGGLVASAWLCFWLSMRWVTRPTRES